MIEIGGKRVAMIGVHKGDGLHMVENAFLRTSAGAKFLFGSLRASADPAEVDGSGYSRTQITVTTPPTTVNVEGGVSPYTFSWAAQSGWTISNPSSATTTFSKPVARDDSDATSFICTVTDATGTSIQVNVAASVSNTYPSASGTA